MAIGGIVACADDDKDHTDKQCIFLYTPEECDDDDGSADEVGDGDGEPTCTTEPDGTQRTTFQCSGRLSATIQFQTLIGNCKKLLGNAAACQETHEFGVGVEPYATPAVMACCDAEGVPEQDILLYCAADLVDQVCRSIPLHIQKLIDGGWLDGKKQVEKQARALQSWLEDNTQQCRVALLQHSKVPGALEPRSFKVPNKDDWNLLNDFTITLAEAVIESATLPETQAEYLPCSDAHDNDTEVFEAKLPLFAGRGVNAAPIAGADRRIVAALSGADDDVYIHSSMLVAGLPVTGLAELALACQQPRCASLTVAEHVGPGVLALEELELFAEGPVTLATLPCRLSSKVLRCASTVRAWPSKCASPASQRASTGSRSVPRIS